MVSLPAILSRISELIWRGSTACLFFLSVSLHEIGCVGCNLRVGYILVLAFEEDPSHEVLAVRLALDSPVTPSTTMKRAKKILRSMGGKRTFVRVPWSRPHVSSYPPTAS